MPHATIKMYPGRSDAQKQQLAEAITAAITSVLGCGENLVSVGIEEVQPADWTAAVYQPEITEKAGSIYKKPGY